MTRKSCLFVMVIFAVHQWLNLLLRKIVKDLGKEDEYEIASAATTEDAIIGGVGHDIDVRSQRVMNEHGIPFNHRQARKWLKRLHKYDYIVGMDEENF